MDNINSKKIFITGIPAAGKSYLANKVAAAVDGLHVKVDDVREELTDNSEYRKWVNFYFNQDEKIYYTTTTPEQRWNDLVAQSEALWPGILEKIKSYKKETKPVIFEGVNILPHLAKKDLPFSGIVLIGRSFEEILVRNKAEPRWGQTEELQKLEADAFFNGERPKYKAEAEKYEYKVFETVNEAYPELIKFFR